MWAGTDRPTRAKWGLIFFGVLRSVKSELACEELSGTERIPPKPLMYMPGVPLCTWFFAPVYMLPVGLLLPSGAAESLAPALRPALLEALSDPWQRGHFHPAAPSFRAGPPARFTGFPTPQPRILGADPGYFLSACSKRFGSCRRSFEVPRGGCSVDGLSVVPDLIRCRATPLCRFQQVDPDGPGSLSRPILSTSPARRLTAAGGVHPGS